MQPALQTAGTLLAGLAGGAVFTLLHMPVSWLSGSMLTVALLAMAGKPMRLPMELRDFGFLVAGVSLGTTITPEALASLQRYPWSLFGLALSAAATVSVSSMILERYFQWDRPTAFLAVVPGALSMVMALAAESAGDVRKIAVVQAMRLFTLVMVMPLAIAATSTQVQPARHAIVTAPDMAVLFAITLAIAAVMRLLRFANPLFMAGMLTSTVLHVSGWMTGDLPAPLIVMGMVLVGTFAGMRFVGTTPRILLAILPAGLVALAVALTIAFCAGLLVHWTTGLQLAEVLVAYAPGAVEAMTMMGAAMGLDTLYISTHHILRTVCLNLVTPLFAPRRKNAD